MKYLLFALAVAFLICSDAEVIESAELRTLEITSDRRCTVLLSEYSRLILSPGFSSIGSMPRSRASLASWKRSAFPPPERGL